MHASKPAPVLIVKGNGFGNFYVPRVNMKWIKGIWYASAVGSLMNGKDRTYPDIVRISELF
jgi:hypothetical protein